MSYLVDLVIIVWAVMQAVALVMLVLQGREIVAMLEAVNNSIERVAVALKKR